MGFVPWKNGGIFVHGSNRGGYIVPPRLSEQKRYINSLEIQHGNVLGSTSAGWVEFSGCRSLSIGLYRFVLKSY